MQNDKDDFILSRHPTVNTKFAVQAPASDPYSSACLLLPPTRNVWIVLHFACTQVRFGFLLKNNSKSGICNQMEHKRNLTAGECDREQTPWRNFRSRRQKNMQFPKSSDAIVTNASDIQRNALLFQRPAADHGNLCVPARSELRASHFRFPYVIRWNIFASTKLITNQGRKTSTDQG